MMRFLGLALASTLVLATLATSPARACENGVERRLQETVVAVARAEQLVDDGKPLLAAQTVLNTYPDLKRFALGRRPLTDRALRVMARAVTRTGGALDAGHRFPGATEQQRADNLAWAQRVLEGFVARDRKDAVAETDLAEMLARRPDARGRALRILTRLAQEDRVASEHGYAALVQLHRDAGEGKRALFAHPLRALHAGEAALAEARCRRLAVDEAVCGGSDPNRPVI